MSETVYIIILFGFLMFFVLGELHRYIMKKIPSYMKPKSFFDAGNKHR